MAFPKTIQWLRLAAVAFGAFTLHCVRTDVVASFEEGGLAGSACETVTVGAEMLSHYVASNVAPTTAAVGGELFIAWSDGVSGTTEAKLLRLDDSGASLGSVAQLTNGGGARPAVVVDGQRIGAVWRDPGPDAGGEGPVWFGLFDLNGQSVGSPLQLSAAATGRNRIVQLGSHYVASWMDRVQSALGFVAVIDTQGNLISAGQSICNWGDCFSVPSVAAAGSEWGVVWGNDGLSPSLGYDVGFRMMSADGSTATEPVALTDDGASIVPVIDWDGSQFGVAFISTDGLGTHVSFVTTAPDGSPGGPVATMTTLPFGAASNCQPSLLWDGQHYVLAWEEVTDTAAELVLTWIDDQGDEVGPRSRLPLATPPTTASCLAPSLAVIGDRYYVAYGVADGSDGELWLASFDCAR